MSSSGVRDIEDSNDRLKKVILGKDESLVDSYKVFDEASSISALAGGGTQSQGEGSAPGNFMLIGGTNWTGRYGHLEEIATIENGLINISRNADNDVTNEASSPMIILNPEGGVADFLDTMLQGSDVLHYPIQYIKIAQGVATITLRPPLLLSITNVVGDGATTTITVTVADTSELTTGDTVDISNTTNFNINDTVITVTGGTTFTCTLDDTGSATSESSGDVNRGNLSLPNDANFDAEADTFLVFIYDLVNQLWSLQSASNALGSGTSGDPTVLDNLDSVDHGTIGAISESFDLEEGNFHFFEASGDVSITFTNLPVSGKWEPILLKITQDNTGSHDITFTQTIENGSPTIDTTADTITVVKFYMYNDGTSDIIRQGDWDASAGGLNTNLSNLSTPTIPTVDLSMNGQAIDNILSLDIEDSAGDTKLGISGPLGVGARFSFVSGDTVFFTEGVTNILSITADGLNLLTNDLTMGTGGNIVGGGATEGMNNIGHLDFIDNTATPAASLSIYSDGTDILVNTGGGVVNISDVGDGVFLDNAFRIQGSVDQSKQLAFEVDGFTTATTRTFTFPDSDGTVFITPAVQSLDMDSNNITNVSYIESDTANRPGSGFIRMATTDEIRMRNVGNDDDIIIQSGTDALGNDAVIFNIAGADQMTMSNLNLDLLQNNLKGVGNITPASASSTDVGDSGTPFLRMFADFFIPDPATIITSRYALAKTGNQLYVNYDSTNADAGFGVYEQGIQQFRFYNPTISETELQFGPDIFESSETYRIVFGANSAAKGLIEYTDAGDLILERTTSTSTTDGVRLRTGGISYLYATSTDISILNTSLNLNSNEIENVVNITSNGGGGATTGTIGELITSDGGFNYFMRDTLAWESDEDTKLTMSSTGITLETNDASDDIAITAAGSTSDITLTATGTITHTVSSTFIQVADGVITFSGGNVFLTNDAEYIGFLDETASASIDTPATGNINLFNDSDTGELSVKKDNGDIVSLEDAASGTQTPWLSNIDADDFALNAVSSIQISDTTSNVHGLLQGLVSVGVRLTLTSGEDFQIYDNITQILEMNSATGLQLFTNDLTMGTGGNIVGGGASEGMTNIGHLDFVDNISTPASSLSIYSDGTDLFANTGGSVVNFSDIVDVSLDGVQDAEPPLVDINFDGTDFEIFISNGKQGYNVSNTSSFTEDNAYYFPIYLGKRARLTDLGWNNIAAATGTITFAMGLYSNIGGGINYPNSRLVVDTSSTVTAATQAAITNSISPTNFEAGLYWIGIVITDLQLGTTVTCSKHENSGANTTGYYDDDGNTDVFLPIFGFVDSATSLPSTAASEMVVIVDTPQAVFARFIANTS